MFPFLLPLCITCIFNGFTSFPLLAVTDKGVDWYCSVKLKDNCIKISTLNISENYHKKSSTGLVKTLLEKKNFKRLAQVMGNAGRL